MQKQHLALVTFVALGASSLACGTVEPLNQTSAELQLSYANGAPDIALFVQAELLPPPSVDCFTVATPFQIGVAGKPPVDGVQDVCAAPRMATAQTTSLTPADFTGGDFTVTFKSDTATATMSFADLGTLMQNVVSPTTAAAGDTITATVTPSSLAALATFKLTPKASTTFELGDGGDVTATVNGDTASIVVPAGTAAGDYFLTAIVDPSQLTAKTCTGLTSCTIVGANRLRAAAVVTVQ